MLIPPCIVHAGRYSCQSNVPLLGSLSDDLLLRYEINEQSPGCCGSLNVFGEEVGSSTFQLREDHLEFYALVGSFTHGIRAIAHPFLPHRRQP
jgi:hypothetical protein